MVQNDFRQKGIPIFHFHIEIFASSDTLPFLFVFLFMSCLMLDAFT